MQYMMEGTTDRFGSRMVVDLNPISLAEKIVADFRERRTKLGWKLPEKNS